MKNLSLQLIEEKVFRDPIHKSIYVNHAVIWELIDTFEFQRLRRIRQLGGTFQVYPTAEHSRFTHSLGVYEILRRMLYHTEIKYSLDENQKVTVLIAGLLHDLGHGPFSHTFENVFKTKHEEYTTLIIEHSKQIRAVLDSYDQNLAQEVCSIITKCHTNKLMVSLVSSHIDADRMDYLLRDSYFCGVSYGQFDLERILRTIKVFEKPERLGFKLSGSYAIEDYLFARYHMYRQVYMHPVSLSSDQTLTLLLSRACELYLSNYQFTCEPTKLIPFFKQDVSVQQYLDLDDANIFVYIQAFSSEKDSILSMLADNILNRRLLEVLVLEQRDLINELKVLHQNLSELEQKYSFILVESSETLNKWLGKIEPTDIQLVDHQNNTLDITQASSVVDAILKHDDNTNVCYVYLDLKWYCNNNQLQNLFQKYNIKI